MTKPLPQTSQEHIHRAHNNHDKRQENDDDGGRCHLAHENHDNSQEMMMMVAAMICGSDEPCRVWEGTPLTTAFYQS